MPAVTEDFVAIFATQGLTSFHSAFASVNSTMDGTAEHSIGASDVISGALSYALGNILVNAADAAWKAMTRVTDAILDFTTDSIGMAIDFESSMANVELAGRRTGLEFEQLKEIVLAVGQDSRLLGIDAEGAASAITNLFGAGLSANEVLGDYNSYLQEGTELTGILRSVTDLQTATTLDMTRSSLLAIGALATYGTEATTAAEKTEFVNNALDHMLRTTNSGIITIEDLEGAMINIGPTAATMGLSIEDTNQALLVLGQRNISGARAGTALRSMLNNLQRDTDDVRGTLDGLGVSLYDVNGQFVGMESMIAQLEQGLYGVGEKTIFVSNRTAEQNALLETAQERYASLSSRIEAHNLGLNTMSESAYAKANQEMQNAAGIIEELTSIESTAVTVTSQLTDEQRMLAINTIAGAYGQQALNALLLEGTEGWAEYSEKISTAAGLQETAARKAETYKAKLEAFHGIIETIQITIGDAFLPVLTELITWFGILVENYGPLVIDIFQRIAGKLYNLVSAVLEFLATGDLTALFPEEVVNVLYGIGEAIQFVTDLIWPHIEAIIQWLTSNVSLQDLLLGIAGGLAVLAAPAIGAAIAGIGTALGVVLPVIGQFVAAIAGGIAVVHLVRKAWETDFWGIRTALTNFWNFWVNKIWPEIVSVAEMVWARLEEIMTAVGEIFQNKSLPMLLNFKDIWVNDIWPEIVAIIEWVAPIIGQVLETIWVFIKDWLIPALLDLFEWWVTVVWPAVLDIMNEVIPVILDFFAQILQWVNEKLIPAVETFWDNWVNIWWPAIQEALANAWEAIKAKFEEFREKFENIKEWLQGLHDRWVEIWDTITTVLTNYWTIIATIFAEVGRWINDNIIPWVDFFAEKWGIAWDLIKELLQSAWDNVILPIWESFKEMLETVLPPIIQALQTIWENTMTAMKGALETLRDIAEPIWASFKQAMEVVLTAALGSLETIWVNSFNAIKGVIEDVKGVWDGIVEAVKNFWTWISSHEFTFKINIPDLPDWATPGSPLPIHTAWKAFSKDMNRMNIKPNIQLPAMEVNGATVMPEVSTGNTFNEYVTYAPTYSLTTQSLTRPGGLAMEFSAMAMMGELSP